MTQNIRDNEKLAGAYAPSEIEAEIKRQIRKTRTESGRQTLRRDLEDIAGGKAELREDVFAIGVDVADADGSRGPKEQQALHGIGRLLRVDPGSGRALS